MTARWLVVLAIAHAHGGETHGGAPAPTAAQANDGAQASLEGTLIDAAVRVPNTVGTPVEATLLLADHVTSAPIAGATARLSLAGPGPVNADLGDAGRTGGYHGAVTFPAAGTYAGSLLVSVPAQGAASEGLTDLLSIPSMSVDPSAAGAEGGAPPSATPPPGAWPAGPLTPAAALLALVAAGAVGVGVGWWLGRRRGAGVAGGFLVAGALALTGQEVEAHGGESHGAAPAAAQLAVGSSLAFTMERQFLVGLRTARTVRASFEARFPVLGRFVARPGEAATVGAPVDGVLRPARDGTRFPSPGMQVRAGQVLAVIEEVQGGADRAALAEARERAATRLAEAQATLALAERDVAALDRLGEGVSDRERLARAGARAVARTALTEAESLVAALATRGVPVTAPVAGRLGPVRVRPGDAVQAGVPLFRVVDTQGAWIEVRVPEGDAASVLPGSTARVVALAHGGTAPGVPVTTPDALPATVLDAGQEVDPATGQVVMTLVVADDPAVPPPHDDSSRHDAGEALRRGQQPPPPHAHPTAETDAAAPRLLPGRSAMVWLGRGGAHPALVVPTSAVIESEGVPLAFVKTGPERFEVRTLTLGGRDGTTVEVLGGLAEGERVVVAGAGTLRILAGR